MNKNYPVILEKRNGFFYCSISELKLISKSENINEAYEKIELLKNERLAECEEYDSLKSSASIGRKSIEDYLKLAVTIMFFALLTIGIGTRLIVALMDEITINFKEKIDMPKNLSSITKLSPEEKALKVKRFEVKIQNAQLLLKEYKPFIDASKPLLKDIQESFDLKRPRQ